VDRKEYKQMLHQVRKGLQDLSNRQLVDTVFAIGKLHQSQTPSDFEPDSVLMPFLVYTIGDMVKEAITRVDSLGGLELAYLAKGLGNLRPLIQSNEKTTEFEIELRRKILDALNEKHPMVATFDPYTVSKLLRYLLAYNDSSDSAINIYKSFSLLLAQTVADRERAL
jgi:hypothetical protein